MPIVGTSPGEALRQFVDHLNRVLAQTLTRRRLVGIVVGDRLNLSFRQAGQPDPAALSTRFGPAWLWLGQICSAQPEPKRRHRLRTEAYTYTLRFGTSDAEPVLRWEYVRERPNPGAAWCRHHIQGSVALPLGADEVSLNDLHTPSGWVAVEEIIRFCINDLGAVPIGADWSHVLDESYAEFREDFVNDTPNARGVSTTS